jgi:hypothetical protein
VSERLGDLSARERELVDAAASGDVLECSQLSIEELSVSDDPEHIIRAELVRELLLKRCDKPPDPRGVRLHGARVTGTLDLNYIEAAVGMELRGCRFDHPVLLRDAHLPWLALTGSCVPALDGDELQVNSNLSLDEGFRVTGHGERGAVRLRGAHIIGQLSLRGAELTNEVGPALAGDRLQVDGALFLDKGFRASGHGERGAVRLVGAHITGELSLSGAELTNEAGPALVGDGLQVDGALFLRGGFRASGRSERGAVRLVGARVTGQLSLRDANLTNEDGLVLDLQDAEVKSIFLPPRLICPQGVVGRSTCDAAACRVALSRLVYTSLEDIHWNQWLHLITRHTNRYQPQPYQQLAAERRAAGHHADARKILIAQQQDLRERGDLGGWPTRTVHYLWGALGGYGYRTGRTALALLIVLLAAAGLGITAGCIHTSPGRYVAMHAAQTDDPHGPCSLLEQIGVGIDRGLPLATTGIRSRCDFDTTSHWGQVITAASWILQLVVWALATGVVAGYVGLIRKAT